MVLQNAPRTTDAKMLTVREASQVLSVHPNTLRKWSDRGMIPTYRIGNRRDRRFVLSDLVDFMDRSQNGGD